MNANGSPRRRTSSPIRLVCIGRWDVCGAAFGGGPIEFRGAHRTGAEAMERTGWGDVDVALIDDSLPDLDTIICLQRLGELAPHVRLIVACEALDQRPAILWLMAGAAGCVAKSAPAPEVARACLTAFDSGLCLPPGLSHEVINTVERLRFVSVLGAELTPREMETLVGVLLGQANKGIAARLGVELSTVKTHVHELLQKLGVATRSELVARCAAAVAAPGDGSPVRNYPGMGDFEI
jgi:two-component system, NarL family, nitrate/nitrite response regulator NarL